MKKLTVYGISAILIVIAGLMGAYFRALGAEQWVLIILYLFAGISIVAIKDFLNNNIQ